MLEIVLVLLTGAAHLIFENVLHLKAPFIAAALLSWTGYVVVRLRRDPTVAREWGLRTDTFRPAVIASGGVFLVGAAGMLAYGALRGSLHLPLTFWVIVWMYPIWGILHSSC